MNPGAIFIARPVATTLLTVGVVLAGMIAFRLLPVSPLPAVDFPTISVSASLPGASPETMATTVATPLERALGQIADITEMTSSSSLGQTRVTLQFDLSRDIDGAARDVQAAINNARSLLPSGSAQQSEVPQDQSGRRADHDPVADQRNDDAGTTLRCRRHDFGAEAGAGERRRRSRHRRCLATRGPRRVEPGRVESTRV